jgi:hypothetical protein
MLQPERQNIENVLVPISIDRRWQGVIVDRFIDGIKPEEIIQMDDPDTVLFELFLIRPGSKGIAEEEQGATRGFRLDDADQAQYVFCRDGDEPGRYGNIDGFILLPRDLPVLIFYLVE